jgi:tryptophan-rich sensory protein
MIGRMVLFAVLNFGALAVGGRFTAAGVGSTWYAGLAKAPWTPPGWVFGAAWTVVMLGFTWFMAAVTGPGPNRRVYVAAYALSWVLNVAWNPLFFTAHRTGWALVDIAALLVLIGGLAWAGRAASGGAVLGAVPYVVWLTVATSLNAYIVVANR